MNPDEHADGAFNSLDEVMISDEGGAGKRYKNVVVKVVDYRSQMDLDTFKPDQNLTLDEYKDALNLFRMKCEKRGWAFERATFEEDAYESWKAQNGLAGDGSRRNVFLLGEGKIKGQANRWRRFLP